MGTISSQDITDLNASPPKPLPVGKLGGRVRIATGTIEAATGDLDVADIIKLTRLPTIARVHSIILRNDDLGTTLTADVGLYETDGTVIDVDAYANAFVLHTASTAGVDAAFTTRDINKAGQQVWQDAGKASDPGGYEDLVLTVDASTTPAAGTISWTVLYSVD